MEEGGWWWRKKDREQASERPNECESEQVSE